MNQHNQIDDCNQEIINFGNEMIKTLVIGISCAIFIAFILGETIRGCAFLVLLLPLRQNAGGLHMKTKTGCAIVSALIYIMALLVLKYVSIPTMVQLILFLCFAVIFIMLAPVHNSVKKLDMDETNVYGNRARMILECEALIFVLFIMQNNEKWSSVVLCILIVCTVLLIMGKIKNSIEGV